MGYPKDLPTQIGWFTGVFFSILTVYWWFDSLFPGRELEPQAMFAKIGASVVTLVISLWLMHINYD